MGRFDKWSKIELKLLYKELMEKKTLTKEEQKLLEQLLEEMKERGIDNEQGSNSW